MYVITINNIMGIKKAVLPLNGTAVVGGYNSTQKSVIIKLAYMTMNSFKSCKSVQRNSVPTGSMGFNPNRSHEIEGYGNELSDDYWESLNSIDWGSAVINSKEPIDKIQALSKRFAIEITKEFYKSFGLNISKHLKDNTSISIIHDNGDRRPDTVFQITKKVLFCSWMHHCSFDSILYLSSTSILDFYKSIKSGSYTGQGGNMSLGNATVMFYDREICDILGVKNNLHEDISWIDNGQEESGKNTLEIIDDNEPIKVDDMGNVYILEDNKYIPVSLVGNGIRLSSILTNLITFRHLDSANDYIFIDEPENGVNPELQNYLGVAFGKAGYNIILTTHSPYLVSSLASFNTNYLITDKTSGQCSLNWKDDCTELLTLLTDPITGL